MNKFILVPKEQYDKFKDLQDIGGVKRSTENSSTDQNYEDRIHQESKSVHKPHNSLKEEISPPPGLPEQYINSSDRTIPSQKSDVVTTPDPNLEDIIQVGYGGTRKGIRRTPEWIKFWNKNIR